MTNLEKFKEVFGCFPFDVFGYCDTDADIWEEQEYGTPWNQSEEDELEEE